MNAPFRSTPSLSASDTPGGSGVANTYYRLDGALEATGTIVTVSTYGDHTLEFWSVDVAANEETPHTTEHFAVTDNTPPSTASDAQFVYLNTATITLTAADAGGSGVADVYYSLDGSAAATGTVVTVPTAGIHTLVFWSVDGAGNVETPPNTVIFSVMDTIAPTTTSDVQPSYDGTATITLTATDTSGGSGVADTYYVVDGGAEATGTVVTVSAVGDHTLEFWSIDFADNIETAGEPAAFTVLAPPTP